MFSEWQALTSTLTSLERKIEILQLHQEIEDRDKSLVAVSTLGSEMPLRHYYRHDYDEVDGCLLSRRQESQVQNLSRTNVKLRSTSILSRSLYFPLYCLPLPVPLSLSVPFPLSLLYFSCPFVFCLISI